MPVHMRQRSMAHGRLLLPSSGNAADSRMRKKNGRRISEFTEEYNEKAVRLFLFEGMSTVKNAKGSKP